MLHGREKQELQSAKIPTFTLKILSYLRHQLMRLSFCFFINPLRRLICVRNLSVSRTVH